MVFEKNIRDIFVGDIDGDGIDDILVVYDDGEIRGFYGERDGVIS